MQRELSIIIVNWNSYQYVEASVSSLLATTDTLDAEIIVVDNASSGDDCELLIRQFEEITVVRAEKNLGFAGANNLGCRMASGKRLLFLNPDTVVIGNAVATMLATLERTARAGIVGCKLLNSDGSLQTSCIQPFPTIFNQIADFDILQERRSRRKVLQGRSVSSSDKVVDVEAISGACLMVDRELYEEVGGFDEGFFMYAEDIALCHEVHRAGRRVLFTSEGSVTHHGGGSTKGRRGNQWVAMMQREAVLRFLRSTRGGAYADAYRLAMGLSAISRLIIMVLMFPFVRRQTKDSFTRFGSVKWMGVLRWSLGLDGHMKAMREGV